MKIKRSELKYLLKPSDVQVIIDFLKSHGQKDAHGNLDGAYRVNSLYLDSYDWWCYRSKKEALDPRYKLRWRWYGNELKSPQFELKQRSSQNIYKTTQVFSNEDYFLLKDNMSALRMRLPQAFQMQVSKYDFHPVAYTHYVRHAFLFDHDFRVTVDTDLAFSSYHQDFLASLIHSPSVVLEIKGNGNLPPILLEMLHLFKLQLTSFSKYQAGVERLFHV